mmetsp:Transcript_10770/g.44807  ORF Transcript_10770/g.44807 Transcript_10770/m.44807 type:complete len:205 (-) Transcript_10770:1381-1995(-)
MPRPRLRARDPGRATTSPGLTRWSLSRRLAAGSTRWWRRRRTSSPATTTTTAATTTTRKISRARMPPRGCRPRVRSRLRRSRRRRRSAIRRMSEWSARGRNAKRRLSAGINPRGPGRRRIVSRLVAAFAPVASCPSPRCTSSPGPADSCATQLAVTMTRIPNRTGTIRNRSSGREGKRRPSRKRRSASATRRSARGPCRSSTAR